ncbi:MAG: hypothetical protein NC299_00850 [Lachnospiraceae bacterium]|nr:hypothetical protein [Ruminococcus sp.]MCM1273896.1 hypothetical protein [Lachnospiraceae bacterium]
MNIKRKIVCAALMAVMLAGCADGGSVESGSRSTASTSSEAWTSPQSSASTSSAAASSSARTSSADVSSESEPEYVPLGEDFKLSGYVSRFDDVKAVRYEMTEIGGISCESSAADRAVEAYVSSEIYADAVKTAYEYFNVENGELMPSSDDIDEDDVSSYVSTWGQSLSVNGSGEIEIGIDVLYGFTARLDGVHDESIVVLRTYLPSSFREWSETTTFFPVIYINGSGEAGVIEILSRQMLKQMFRIDFDDGTTQVMVTSGHSSGTERAIIVSFKDGVAAEEISASSIWGDDSAFWEGFDRIVKPFFWDGEKYCCISGAEPSKALADIICADKDILARVPDAAKEIEDGNVFVIGGRYVTFQASGVTFEVDCGRFESCRLFIYRPSDFKLSRSEDYWQFEDFEVPAYNVNLDG